MLLDKGKALSWPERPERPTRLLSLEICVQRNLQLSAHNRTLPLTPTASGAPLKLCSSTVLEKCFQVVGHPLEANLFGSDTNCN